MAKLRAAGVDADVLQFDITKPADYQPAYDYFNSRYGRLDILVNNAGIAAGTFPGTGPEHPPSDVRLTAAQGLRNQLLRTGSTYQDACCPCSKRAPPAVSSTSPAFSARSPCTPTRIAHLPRQILRLRCIEDRTQRLHRSPRLRAARHPDQGQLRPSWLGQNRHGRRPSGPSNLSEGARPKRCCWPTLRYGRIRKGSYVATAGLGLSGAMRRCSNEDARAYEFRPRVFHHLPGLAYGVTCQLSWPPTLAPGKRREGGVRSFLSG